MWLFLSGKNQLQKNIWREITVIMSVRDKKEKSEVPKILYKYRKLSDKYTDKIFSDGEIYFAHHTELEDPTEHLVLFRNGEMSMNRNNKLEYQSPWVKTKIYQEEIRKSDKGIFSLCSGSKEIQMYQQYAGDCDGVCIGFDWEKFGLFFVGSVNYHYYFCDSKKPDINDFKEYDRAVFLYSLDGYQTYNVIVKHENGKIEEPNLREFFKQGNKIDPQKYGFECGGGKNMIDCPQDEFVKFLSLHCKYADPSPQVRSFPRKVRYHEKLTVMEELEAQGYRNPEAWIEVFCRKLDYFCYEKEYRIFYNRGKYQSLKVREAIREVIFGADVSDEKIQNVKNLLANLPHINFYRLNTRVNRHLPSNTKIDIVSI